jgi:hypothetical protein
MPPDAGLWNYGKIHLLALIVGLAGDQTQAICVARSSAKHSAIHYDLKCTITPIPKLGLQLREKWVKRKYPQSTGGG